MASGESWNCAGVGAGLEAAACACILVCAQTDSVRSGIVVLLWCQWRPLSYAEGGGGACGR